MEDVTIDHPFPHVRVRLEGRFDHISCLAPVSPSTARWLERIPEDGPVFPSDRLELAWP